MLIFSLISLYILTGILTWRALYYIGDKSLIDEERIMFVLFTIRSMFWPIFIPLWLFTVLIQNLSELRLPLFILVYLVFIAIAMYYSGVSSHLPKITIEFPFL
jgi:hypothetical protein